MVSREPRPIGVLLSSDDYPRLAKKKNETGRVVLEIYIDTQGGVRDVHLMVSSSPELNEVAVRKLKEARFEPAYDATGRPVACKMTLPIRFELE
jgi:protein TonB